MGNDTKPKPANKVHFIIEGYFELDSYIKLGDAIECLREADDKLREYGTVDSNRLVLSKTESYEI